MLLLLQEQEHIGEENQEESEIKMGKGSISIGFSLKILGAIIGCVGFILMATTSSMVLPSALIGIGTLLIAGGGEYGG